MTGPLLWEQPYGEVELPPGDDPLVLIAPSTRRTRRAACAPPSTASRASPCACSPPPTAGRRPGGRRAGERPPRRLGLVRAHDAALQRRRLPRRARHPRPRPGLRGAGRGLPARRRHGENSARIRWAGRVSLPRRFQHARGIRLALRRLLGEPAYARRARATRLVCAERRRRHSRRRARGLYPGGVNSSMASETRGYTATKDQLQSRLHRIEGQVRASRGWSRRTATASTF